MGQMEAASFFTTFLIFSKAVSILVAKKSKEKILISRTHSAVQRRQLRHTGSRNLHVAPSGDRMVSNSAWGLRPSERTKTSGIFPSVFFCRGSLTKLQSLHCRSCVSKVLLFGVVAMQTHKMQSRTRQTVFWQLSPLPVTQTALLPVCHTCEDISYWLGLDSQQTCGFSQTGPSDPSGYWAGALVSVSSPSPAQVLPSAPIKGVCACGCVCVCVFAFSQSLNSSGSRHRSPRWLFSAVQNSFFWGADYILCQLPVQITAVSFRATITLRWANVHRTGVVTELKEEKKKQEEFSAACVCLATDNLQKCDCKKTVIYTPGNKRWEILHILELIRYCVNTLLILPILILSTWHLASRNNITLFIVLH